MAAVPPVAARKTPAPVRRNEDILAITRFRLPPGSLSLALLGCLVAAAPPTAGANETSCPPDFAAIDRYLAERFLESRVPGLALAIVQDGEIRHLKGFGVADRGGKPVTPRTPFILGSTAKGFTALAVMQLVEEGRLELDAPVRRYLPWFAVTDPLASETITLRHLLNHTSGLPTSAGNQPMSPGDTSGAALEHGVRALRSARLDRPVGKSYEYCNANYNTLGLVVQTVRGRPYEDVIEERIFRPLAMEHAFTSEEGARRAGLAVGHHFFFNRPIPAPHFAYPRSFLPAGFLIASAEDMAHYLIAQTNGGRFGDTRVLSAAGIDTLHAAAVPLASGRPGGYGMGWVRRTMNDTPLVWHNGDSGHFHSEILLVPDGNWGVVLLGNGSHPRTALYYQEMAAGVSSLLVGKEARSDARIHRAAGIAFRVVLGLALVQILGLVVAVIRQRRRRREPARRGRVVTAGVLNVALAAGLLWVLDAYIAPLPEIVVTMPDLGLAVLSSVVVAAGWTARTALSLR